MRSSAQTILGFAACWWGLLAVADDDEAVPKTTTKPSLNFLRKSSAGDMGGVIEMMEKDLPKLFQHLKGKFDNPEQIDIPASGSCGPAIKRLCAEVEFGNAKVAHCLDGAAKAAKNRKEEKVMSPPCSKQLAAILLVMSHMKHTDKATGPIPVDLVPGLRDACNSDAEKHCELDIKANNTGKKLKGYMACLQKLSYEDKLRPVCAKKMTDVQIMFSKNLMLDPKFFKACAPKIKAIEECRKLPFTPFSGQGEKQACLKRHPDELDTDCKNELDRVEKLQSKDVRTNAAVFSNCREELSTLCKNVQFGEARVMQCLWKNIDKEGFSEHCRKKVKGETKSMLSNYTKDYRVATRCKAAIDGSCAEAKMKNEKGWGSSDETNEGIVYQCLKMNFATIGSVECKKEVRRVVKIHAKSPEMNPQWLKKCGDDAKEYCASAEHVHLCLRKNLGEISKGCKRVELLQGSLEARDISLKPAMKQTCTSAITDFCKDVPEGGAQVIRCLRKHYDEKEFPSACAKHVKEDLEASQHDLRLKFGVSDECKDDAEEFCPDSIHNGGLDLISCLKSNLKELKKSQCKKGMHLYIEGANENIKADPVTYKACVDDVAFFCAGVSPGQGRVHECLLNNKLELGRECALAEFNAQQLLASDVTLSPMVMRKCHTAIKANCQDVKTDGAKLWECLEDLTSKTPANLPTKCRQQVVYHIRLKNSELHLNPALYETCKKDFENLCEDDMIGANEKSFQSNGAAINCLIEKRREVKDDDCKKSMLKTMKQRVVDIKANPQAHGICKTDIDRFCAEAPAGPGEVQKCLKEKMKELGHLCQTMIGKVMRMQSEDIQLQPALQKNCVSEMKQFCADVPAGSGMVEACLQKQLHHSDMQPDCKKALEKKVVTQSKSILLNPVLLRACAGQFEKLRGMKLCKGLDLGDNSDVPDISKLNPADFFKKPELQGHIRQCLLDRRENISSILCKAAVTSELAKESNDFRANPIAWQSCTKDLKELCEGMEPGRGRWLQCLSKYSNKIENKKCKTMVKLMFKAQREDATINPGIVRNCQHEQKSFCNGIEHGQSKILKCLASSMNETSFGQECRMALINIQAQTLFKVGKGVKKVGVNDIMKWLEINKKSSRGMLTGAIAGCLVALALLSACFLALKKGVFAKNGYAVVPRHLSA